MQNPFVFFVKSFVCVALLLFTSNLIAQKTKYKIDATLDSEERLIFVKQKIIFTNPDTEKLNVLFYCVERCEIHIPRSYEKLWSFKFGSY